MAHEIWKFAIPTGIDPRCTVNMPRDAQFLTFGVDGTGRRCIWAMVNPKAEKWPVEIIKVGAGWEVPHVGTYLGTIIDDGYVWHYFTGPAHSMPRAGEMHYHTKGNGND